MSDVLPHIPSTLGPLPTLGIKASVGIAKGLSRMPPNVLRSFLERIATGARPATYEEARLARDAVLTASPYSRGGSACLPRSLATVLVCRARGTWPQWCVGVLSSPPFTAHAWIEVDGVIVDEPMAKSDFSTFFSVSSKSMLPQSV
ncbi:MULTISPECIES: lasso peptide biosynthesis B2 protein [Nocardiaceae]|uniref:lasso peptide biosynthesis B2 protein n=1 Tax=Nocardiaceae TaxID=85025 RepID=UPI00050BE455|nr:MULTISPECIES: lasso peptide biosynthesis B2 protein [Rhodococcus]